MKIKIISIAIFLGSMVGTLIGQGTVQWNFINPVGFTSDTNTTELSPIPWGGFPLAGGSDGPTTTVPNSFYYELLYNTAPTQQPAPSTVAALDQWQDTGLEGVNSTSAGKVNALNPSTAAVVPFTAATSIMLVGWSANMGSTWSEASAFLNGGLLESDFSVAFFGESNTGFLTPNAAGVDPGAILFGAAPGQIYSPNTPLYAIILAPEPATIALGVVGGLSLLALRRKQTY